MSDAARALVLFEQMNGKFDAILEYVRDIPDIKERVGVLEVKTDRLQTDMTMVKSIVKDHSADIAELRTEVTEMKADIVEIKGDLTEMKGDMAGVKGDVAELRGDVADLKGDVVELKGDIAELKGDVVELKTDMVEVKLDLSVIKGLIKWPPNRDARR